MKTERVYVYCTGEIESGRPSIYISQTECTIPEWVLINITDVDLGVTKENLLQISRDIAAGKLSEIDRLRDERDMLAAQLAAIQSEEDEGVDHVNG